MGDYLGVSAASPPQATSSALREVTPTAVNQVRAETGQQREGLPAPRGAQRTAH